MNKIAYKYHFKHMQYLSICLYLLIELLTLISPKIMEQIIDVDLVHKNNKGIIIGIILFISIPLLRIILTMVYNYILIKYIRKKGNEISMDIMKSLIYKDFSFYDQNKSLEILSYTSKEAVSYVNFYIADLGKYYVSIFLTIFTLLLMIYIHPFLGFIQLLYIPVSILPVKWMMKSIDQEVSEVIKINAIINQIKGDIFKGIEFIKIHRLEEYKLQEVQKYNHYINKIWGKIAALDTTSGIFASGFIVSLFTGITFGIGALLVINSSFALQKEE